MLLAYGLIVILLGARRGRRPYLWYAAAADDSELCERRVPAAGHTYGTPPGSSFKSKVFGVLVFEGFNLLTSLLVVPMLEFWVTGFRCYHLTSFRSFQHTAKLLSL